MIRYFQRRSPGQRAFDRCLVFAGIAMVYLVCGIAGPLLSVDFRGGIAEQLFTLIYFNPNARYVVMSFLLGLFAWGAVGVVRAWRDPLARILRFCTFVPLIFLLAMSCAAFLCSDRQELPKEKEIPQEIWQALRTPAHVMLYSIDPEPGEIDGAGNPVSDGQEKFHKYPVIGSVNLDGEKAATAARAFHVALDQPTESVLSMSMCFNPRHGLRVTSNGHEYDFLLCYQCEQMEVFRDGEEIVGRKAKGSPKVLNALLTEAKVPLAKVLGE